MLRMPNMVERGWSGLGDKRVRTQGNHEVESK